MSIYADKRAVLFDLDDTLYVCGPGESAGLDAVVAIVSGDLGLDPALVRDAYVAARRAVKARIDGRGSSHARLLYLAELAHALGRADALVRVRAWERAFWSAFLGASRLRPRARPFLEALRGSGRKIAIVTDLTLEVQLWKLEALGLFPFVDALAVSEEVPEDKPAAPIFELALARLGVGPEASLVVGDHDGKDGEGARRLGMPFVRIDASDVEGVAFEALARELAL